MPENEAQSAQSAWTAVVWRCPDCGQVWDQLRAGPTSPAPLCWQPGQHPQRPMELVGVVPASRLEEAERKVAERAIEIVAAQRARDEAKARALREEERYDQLAIATNQALAERDRLASRLEVTDEMAHRAVVAYYRRGDHSTPEERVEMKVALSAALEEAVGEDGGHA